jgi:hypothetical protein
MVLSKKMFKFWSKFMSLSRMLFSVALYIIFQSIVPVYCRVSFRVVVYHVYHHGLPCFSNFGENTHRCHCLPCFSPLSLSSEFLSVVTVYHASYSCHYLPCFSPLPLPPYHVSHRCPCLPCFVTIWHVFHHSHCLNVFLRCSCLPCFSVVTVYHVSHRCHYLPNFSPLSLPTMFLTVVTVYYVLHRSHCLPCFSPLLLSTTFFTVANIYHVSHRCYCLLRSSP